MLRYIHQYWHMVSSALLVLNEHFMRVDTLDFVGLYAEEDWPLLSSKLLLPDFVG